MHAPFAHALLFSSSPPYLPRRCYYWTRRYLLTAQGRNVRMKLFAQFDLGGNIPKSLVSMGLSDSTCKDVNNFIRTSVGQSAVSRLRDFDEQLKQSGHGGAVSGFSRGRSGR